VRLEDGGRLAEVEVLLPVAPGDVHVPAAVDELRRRGVELVAQGLEGVRDDPAVVASPVGVVDVAAQGMRFLDRVETLGPVLGEDVGDAWAPPMAITAVTPAFSNSPASSTCCLVTWKRPPMSV